VVNLSSWDLWRGGIDDKRHTPFFYAPNKNKTLFVFISYFINDPIGHCNIQIFFSQEISMGSLVLGILGLFGWFIPLIGLPITIVGLILGIKGLSGTNRGVSITGIVLNIIGLLFSIINAAIGAYLGATGQMF
jgi:hypothetical protein